jgi:hypothetical protein
MLISNRLKRLSKMHPEKLFTKMRKKYNFLLCIFFFKFFSGLKISLKFCILVPFVIFPKYILAFFRSLALFANFEAKSARNSSKNQLEFSFAPITGPVFLFSKKK